MSYFTTIKVVNSSGKPIKAEVNCGGKSRGFTDEKTGELSFDLISNSSFRVSAKQYGKNASGTVIGGKTVTLRIN